MDLGGGPIGEREADSRFHRCGLRPAGEDAPGFSITGRSQQAPEPLRETVGGPGSDEGGDLGEAPDDRRLVDHLQDHADPGRIRNAEYGDDVHDALPQSQVTVDEVLRSVVVVQMDVAQAVDRPEEVTQAVRESRMPGVERESESAEIEARSGEEGGTRVREILDGDRHSVRLLDLEQVFERTCQGGTGG